MPFEDVFLYDLLHMQHNQDENVIREFVESLMHGRTESELQEAEENFRRYLLIVERIARRKAKEQQNHPP